MLQIIEIPRRVLASEGRDLPGCHLAHVQDGQRRTRKFRGHATIQEREGPGRLSLHRQPGSVGTDADRRGLRHRTQWRGQAQQGRGAPATLQGHAEAGERGPVQQVESEVHVARSEGLVLGFDVVRASHPDVPCMC